MIRWQIQEAKNRLSELVRKAQRDGPQVITLHGRDAVVVLAASEYRNLSLREGSLAEFLGKSPLGGVDLELKRSRDTGRDIKL